jgi:hypothetical protein
LLASLKPRTDCIGSLGLEDPDSGYSVRINEEADSCISFEARLASSPEPLAVKIPPHAANGGHLGALPILELNVAVSRPAFDLATKLKHHAHQSDLVFTSCPA